MDLREKSFDQYDFIDFLKGLREKVSAFERVYCLVDNLGVHKTHNVYKIFKRVWFILG